jgi:anti-sigma factor RsiW
MNLDIGQHVAEDVLEKYLMHCLPDGETASVEEHLLACPSCQVQAEETEDFILATKVALREPGRKPAARSAHAAASGAMLSWFSLPVVATASLGLALGTYLHPRQAAPSAPPAEVRLSTTRGADSALPHVRAASRLILDLDTRDLPADASYDVRLVNSGGVVVWTGVPQRLGDSMRVDVMRAEAPHKLPPGHYWVRLSRGGELVREYGVSVE